MPEATLTPNKIPVEPTLPYVTLYITSLPDQTTGGGTDTVLAYLPVTVAGKGEEEFGEEIGGRRG